MRRFRLHCAIFPIFSVLFFFHSSCDKVGTFLENLGLSNEEIVQGLRVALDTAARDASGSASAVNGFLLNETIKILLPEDVAVPLGKLQTVAKSNPAVAALVGDQLDGLTDEFVVSMNRAAELASTKALPIFSNAIREMTLSDGLAILQGGDSAATVYMRGKTEDGLKAVFKPVVQDAMDQVRVMEYWKPVSAKYNQIMSVPRASTLLEAAGVSGLPKQLPSDFTDYVTSKGLNGLYKLMEGEEKKIRENPMGYASNIIQKVFSSAEAKVRR